VNEIVGCLATQHAELDALLAGLGDAGWNAPTRCPGWTVADVVLHLAQTDELAAATTRGRLAEAGAGAGWTAADRQAGATVDDAAATAVDAERGVPAAELLSRWRAAAAAERHALAACDPGERLTWVTGLLSARTLATTRLAEGWIHTGDVADALGADVAQDDRLRHIARLAWRTVPYAFARAGADLAGPVAVVLDAPGGGQWTFGEGAAATTVRGEAVEFCLVAARRLDPAKTTLRADGPDAAGVLALVRTYA